MDGSEDASKPDGWTSWEIVPFFDDGRRTIRVRRDEREREKGSDIQRKHYRAMGLWITRGGRLSAGDLNLDKQDTARDNTGPRSAVRSVVMELADGDGVLDVQL
jgi:hypothetical protein